MTNDIKYLLQRGDKLHGNRSGLMSLCQEITDNFYPERGNFTTSEHIGTGFADHLYSSYPLIVRRDLGDAAAAMLRPKSKVWMHMTIAGDEDRLSASAKQWLEDKTRRQMKVMYDAFSGFVRATKEGDHDFMTYGQCVIQRETDWSRPGFLYRSWHFRDVAWAEAYSGKIDEIHRNWRPDVRTLVKRFPETVHPDVRKLVEKEPFREVPCRAIVLPVDDYGGERKDYRLPWVVSYLDIEHKHLMQEVNVHSHGYTIPRWKTVSGSQYAFSPATIAALPDARLLQAMTLTLLEAGEAAVRPPMVATTEAIRSDVQLYPGGITWADVEYDERKGDVLRPISQNLAGLPFALEQQDDIRQMLATAFYLNKITMPSRDKDMTAYEASKLYEQYIRDVVPLFEPMETDYNGALCDDTFSEALRIGVFGPTAEIPPELLGQDVIFRFESPLHDAIEREKSTKLEESLRLIGETMQVDENTGLVMDAVTALRDSLRGLGDPEKWIRDEESFASLVEQAQQQKEAEQSLAMAQQAGDANKALGNAAS